MWRSRKKQKNIKGFVLPFNTSEKGKKEDKVKKYKFKSKEDIQLIKEKVKALKKEREDAKKREEEMKNKEYQKHRNVMKHLHNKLIREKGEPVDTEDMIHPARNNSQVYDVSQDQLALKLSSNQQAKKFKESLLKKNTKLPNKFTIDSLMKLKYDDIAGSGPDGFNPADILDTDSGSDDSVLNQYRGSDNQVPINQNISQSNNQGLQKGIRNTERAVPIDNQNSLIPHQKAHLRRKEGKNNSTVGVENIHVRKSLKNSLGNNAKVQNKSKLKYTNNGE